jgi:hypothetical protein
MVKGKRVGGGLQSLALANNSWPCGRRRPLATASSIDHDRRRRVARRVVVCVFGCMFHLSTLSLSLSTYDRSTKLAVGGWSFAISTESGRSDGLTLQVDFGMKTASARLIMAIPSIYMFHR